MDIINKKINVIFDKKKQIKEQIFKLKEEENNLNNTLKEIQKILNIEVKKCELCYGSGECHIDCSNGNGYGSHAPKIIPCSECEGKGYIIIEN